MFLSYLAKLNGQRLRSSLISANSFARGRTVPASHILRRPPDVPTRDARIRAVESRRTGGRAQVHFSQVYLRRLSKPFVQLRSCAFRSKDAKDSLLRLSCRRVRRRRARRSGNLYYRERRISVTR